MQLRFRLATALLITTFAAWPGSAAAASPTHGMPTVEQAAVQTVAAGACPWLMRLLGICDRGA
ncbi:hypothetical protein H5392_13995 [Tessaracoccus sp. MC1865]|uniref:hypothetical protein n=1 Tax=Tessaracoccus sp. MC1865 TaxID=2760310 RepID=UPI00160132E7|nr:hypothetical protein [Tessaracoccus sp. MC1865]MBB1484969.1 hypothetical protein [Tessaracoccus sp. MC1865]QTO38684.1 hypothetical protein J7D54_06330 [Tessaracoccus sp. MC1865]